MKSNEMFTRENEITGYTVHVCNTEVIMKSSAQNCPLQLVVDTTKMLYTQSEM